MSAQTSTSKSMIWAIRKSRVAHYHQAQAGFISPPTTSKALIRNIDNHMANWKVIALVSGNIEGVSGPAAQDRPGSHEWTVREGTPAQRLQLAPAAS